MKYSDIFVHVGGAVDKRMRACRVSGWDFMNTVLKNHRLRLEFSGCGALVSLNYAGEEFIATNSPREIFTLALRRRDDGKSVEVSSLDFTKVQPVLEEVAEGALLRISFRGCRRFEQLEAEVGIRLRRESDFSSWNMTVHCLPEQLYCDYLLFPQFELRNTMVGNGGDGEFFWPGMEGTVFREFKTRQRCGGFASSLLSYPLTGIGPYYPGPVPMQFQAYTTGNGSLYFGCHDLSHAPKGIDVTEGVTGNIHPWWQFFPGGAETEHFNTPGEFVLGGFQGDWQDACIIYRNWMECHDRTLPLKTIDNSDIPGWLKDSPVLLIYPVKGSGFDTGSLEGNEYFPYNNGLEVCRFYHQEWQTPVMALLMHWEGTAPWAPPYVWPPYGGEELLRDFGRRLHEQGDLLGVYCSGTAWTSTSSIDPSYSREKEFAEKHLEHEMCVGPEGEMYAKVCNGPPGQGQRIGYDCCVARPWTVDTVVEEIRKCVTGSGIDYLQYFDQNQGCSAPLCYARDHHHPGSPGPWLTEAMISLLDRVRGVIDTAAPGVVIGCENAAAQPYIRNLQLNDLRYHLSWLYSTPVPAYSMVFHEYINNFTGNGVGMAGWLDRRRSPWFILHRLAYSFINGEILSVVLKDRKEVHWSWVCSWNDAAPEQLPIRRLIANMCAWRRHRAGEFLIFGRMEKNVVVNSRKRMLYFTNEHAPQELDIVLSSRWSFRGREAVIVINPSDAEERASVVFAARRSGVCYTHPEHDAESRPFDGSEIVLNLEPYQIVMLEMS